MILRICEARVCGPQSLRLSFSDGTTKQVDVSSLLDGPIFETAPGPGIFRTCDPGLNLRNGHLAQWRGLRPGSAP